MKTLKICKFVLLGSSLFVLVLLSACKVQSSPPPGKRLRLATTTSTYDSGLLDAILPDFETRYQVTVDVVAVGTGQALALGREGDVDVLLVHAPSKEEAFVAEGFGTQRYPVMYNDFILVGPAEDPAGVTTAPDAATALSRIAQTHAGFASRGDQSGTHTREQELWALTEFSPSPEEDWYFSLGQGMGATLNFANEKELYTLTDRGTFLAMGEHLPSLTVLFGGQGPVDNPDPALLNYYSVIPVNPALFPGIQAELAQQFVTWLTSIPTQELIADYGLDIFGQTLFFPNSDAWNASRSSQ
jgi:tungstate transport system substrate-binding protein